jgi:hypothetical protein
VDNGNAVGGSTYVSSTGSGTRLTPSWEAAEISYRTEVGAVLLAIAASGLIGLRQRVTRRRSQGGPGVLAAVILLVVAAVVGGSLMSGLGRSSSRVDVPSLIDHAPAGSTLAALRDLAVKGRAPKTGYSREQFGAAWSDVDRNGCDTRDDILRRDLTSIQVRAATAGCVVVAGSLADPYTGTGIAFTKSAPTKVQIDHVVALSDAWQTGAQGWPASTRLAFANDPLNLLAVDGGANQQKGDADASAWLPSHKAFRCAYVSRQVAVKARYRLWVTAPERDAVARILHHCPDQRLP